MNFWKPALRKYLQKTGQVTEVDNRTLLTKELVGLYDQLDLNIPRSEIDRFSVDAIKGEISKATALLDDQELI